MQTLYYNMSNEFQLRDWILLSMAKGVGPAAMRRLLVHFESPAAVRRASHKELSNFVLPAVAENIRAAHNQKAANDACKWAEKPDCTVLTLADVEYPRPLSEIANPPILLYVRGDCRALTARPQIAIVGSRSASHAGVANTTIFARTLAEAGLYVVSGLAQGIDSAAHRGAMQGNGKTIAVIGTGIDIVYPKQSRGMAMDIIAHGGAIISEFPLGAPPIAHNFPHRNRIISGLAAGCLVMEATLKSGSMNTAECSAEQGREVFAVPGSINDPMHRGCHHLIKQGAKLAENVEDILTELKLHNLHKPASGKANANPSHPSHPLIKPTEEEEQLLRFIDFEPTSVDDIAARSGLSAEQLLSSLLDLEMSGKIIPTHNGGYQRC